MENHKLQVILVNKEDKVLNEYSVHLHNEDDLLKKHTVLFNLYQRYLIGSKININSYDKNKFIIAMLDLDALDDFSNDLLIYGFNEKNKEKNTCNVLSNKIQLRYHWASEKDNYQSVINNVIELQEQHGLLNNLIFVPVGNKKEDELALSFSSDFFFDLISDIEGVTIARVRPFVVPKNKGTGTLIGYIGHTSNARSILERQLKEIANMINQFDKVVEIKPENEEVPGMTKQSTSLLELNSLYKFNRMDEYSISVIEHSFKHYGLPGAIFRYGEEAYVLIGENVQSNLSKELTYLQSIDIRVTLANLTSINPEKLCQSEVSPSIYLLELNQPEEIEIDESIIYNVLNIIQKGKRFIR